MRWSPGKDLFLPCFLTDVFSYQFPGAAALQVFATEPAQDELSLSHIHPGQRSS